MKGNRLGVKQKIDLCRQVIVLLNKEQQRNSQELIKKFKQELEEAIKDIELNNDKIQLAKDKLNVAYKDEKYYCKQRSRQLWLSLGDKNTSYFHIFTRQRYVINKFSVIEDESGRTIFKEELSK